MGIKSPEKGIFDETIKHFEKLRTAEAANQLILDEASERINEFKRPGRA
jgi:hypothetical protein